METSDRKFLLRALELAEIRRGFCAPNPSVGAVVVQDGECIAEGYHQAAGQAHAEVEALARAGSRARGATLYVSLEPCCHWGRTPPCTDAILAHGVARVVYGFRDPNPVVAGIGEARLREAGIACERLELEELKAFYRSYRHWRETGRPFVTTKLALSLDGKIAGPGGAPVALTGEAAARVTHASRGRADAILSTARTVRRDDPRLDVRREGMLPSPKDLYLLDGRAELPLEARIFSTGAKLTLFHLDSAPAPRIHALALRGVKCVATPSAGNADWLDLNFVLEHIGRDGKHDLWIEAGGTLFESLVQAGAVSRALFYIAPKWLGATGLPAFPESIAHHLERARPRSSELLGRDVYLEWEW